MSMIDSVRAILAEVLQLGPRASSLQRQTPLLGAIPELDSMAVVNVITAIEDKFGVTVADDEITADTFATLGTLTAFVEQKLAP